jgi:hypothetical protein
MLIPRYWECAERTVMGRGKRHYRLRVWGWSQDGTSEARAVAARRLEEAVRRLEERGELPGGYGLYGDDRPVREELLEVLAGSAAEPTAAVTRNRYGALVLNTARIPFIDVDVTPPGFFTRLLGRLRREPVGFERALERVRETCRAHADRSFRIYRTAAGFRLLVTDVLLDPAGEETSALMKAFAADPHFVRLCRIQQSFRARLTPKPWRCGCTMPPSNHPRVEAAAQERFQAWRSGYETATERYATCRFVESLGPGHTRRETAAIVDRHDRMSRALEDRPLA